MDEQNQQAAAETTNADAQQAQGVVGESSAAAAPASTSQPAADTTSKSSEPQGTGEGNAAGGASSGEPSPAVYVVGATAGVAGEQGNAGAPASDAAASTAVGAAVQSELAPAGDAPNAALAAGAQPATQPSAAPASTPAGTSPTGANSPASFAPCQGCDNAQDCATKGKCFRGFVSTQSDAPLHVSVAHHLEAIFSLVKGHTQSPIQTASAAATEAKSHIGDILHKISNGMSVAEGELVQKLQKLFHLL